MARSKASELIPATGTIYIAFSGGPDSVCLAHWVREHVELSRITCIHIDHGLDPGSAKRAGQAKALAEALNLNCIVETLSLQATSNIEAIARQARYACFKSHIETGDCLMTAHHADDVAETMLLRLLRGASLSGLGGIQASQPFGLGVLIRPLLSWTQDEVISYLDQHQLPSINDPTNDCLSLDRNFIRSEIMPAIKSRFTGAVSAINRSARLNAQAYETLAHYIDHDLRRDQQPHRRLDTHSWKMLTPFHRAELVRRWCIHQGVTPPPGKPLETFIHQVQSAARDRCPELSWDHHRLYHYQDHLWLEVLSPAQHTALNTYRIDWTGEAPLELPPPLGTLSLSSKVLADLGQQSDHRLKFMVQAGQPGERIDLKQGSRHVHSLMSQAHIPPWQRTWWPRLWWGDRLIACGQRWQHPMLNNELTWVNECFDPQPMR